MTEPPMSDDPSNSSQSRQTWLEKLSQAFSGEPQSKEDLLEIVRASERRGNIDSDALSLIEGAMQVTDMQVREIMIPRAQIVTIDLTENHTEFIAKIIETAYSHIHVIDYDHNDVI